MTPSPLLHFNKEKEVSISKKSFTVEIKKGE